MQGLKKILLTGGIASGKSAVSAILSSCGVPVYDSDSAAKRLYQGQVLSEVEKSLALSLRSPDGTFDKGRLAAVIFSSPEALYRVEAIVHPALIRDFEVWLGRQSTTAVTNRALPERGFFSGLPPFVVMESAIALEKPLFDGYFDAVVMVDAPVELRIARACARDGVSREKVTVRVAAQCIGREKADAVIVNDCGIDRLRERTLEAFASLKGRI